MSTNSSTALIVNVLADECDHVQQCLGEWRCVAGELDDNQRITSEIPEQLPLALVYARKTEKETLAICEQLRKLQRTSAVPILLVVGRYMIGQIHPVKRMGNAEFIMTPFSQQQIREKIAASFAIS